jgi:hypothetical protein
MKKAQWKQDPRERAFGKDPREVLNQKLTERVHELETWVAHLKQSLALRSAHEEEQRKRLSDRIKDLQPQAQAYAFLRHEGVVLTNGEEFKHLKGDDMDAYFGIESPPKVTQNLWQSAMLANLPSKAAMLANPPTKIMAPPFLQQQVEQLINAEFEKSFNECMLTGTGTTKWP